MFRLQDLESPSMDFRPEADSCLLTVQSFAMIKRNITLDRIFLCVIETRNRNSFVQIIGIRNRNLSKRFHRVHKPFASEKSTPSSTVWKE